jgi:ABC-2 type transport system ATP-binding protein
MPLVVEISHLTKRYGTFIAVNDVNFSVPSGEIFALLGPNGAGKTTTIRLLMGILVPSGGTARICGFDCFKDRVAVKRHVGYVPDEPVFYDFLKGREVIEFTADLRGLKRSDSAKKIDALVERLEMGDAMEEFAVNYSRGMKKKLALICAFLHEPDLLILDEPTNGLDPLATRELLKLIGESAQCGKTVFYSTHLLDQAEKLCTSAGIIAEGALKAHGTLQELRQSASNTLEQIFFSVAGKS